MENTELPIFLLKNNIRKKSEESKFNSIEMALFLYLLNPKTMSQIENDFPWNTQAYDITEFEENVIQEFVEKEIIQIIQENDNKAFRTNIHSELLGLNNYKGTSNTGNFGLAISLLIKSDAAEYEYIYDEAVVALLMLWKPMKTPEIASALKALKMNKRDVNKLLKNMFEKGYLRRREYKGICYQYVVNNNSEIFEENNSNDNCYEGFLNFDEEKTNIFDEVCNDFFSNATTEEELEYELDTAWWNNE